MNAKIKKSLKFVTLLITALVIAAASAATYNYMYVTGSVTISNSKLDWIAGSDAPGDISITGGTVTMDLDVQNGTMQVFTEALFLKNKDASDHALNVTVTTALLSADFDTSNAKIYGNSTGSWELLDTLNLMTAQDQYSSTLTAGNYYRFTFEIQAKADAAGTKNFVLQVTYV
jgi:hypothetical protein